MNIRDILIKARDHIKDPKMWKKGHTFTRELMKGKPCCGYNAVRWAVNCSITEVFDDAILLFPENIIKLNDAPKTTHADIMDLFNRTISLAPHVPLPVGDGSTHGTNQL